MSFWSFLKRNKADTPIDTSEIRDRMIIATAEALETLPLFWSRFDLASNKCDFLLKLALSTPDDGCEYVWVDWIAVIGDQYEASLANEPVNLPGRHARDRVTFTQAEIIDWAYPTDAGYCGHFTTRAMLSLLDPKTAAEVKKTLAANPIESVN